MSFLSQICHFLRTRFSCYMQLKCTYNDNNACVCQELMNTWALWSVDLLFEILILLSLGYVGGSHYSHFGAAVEPLCLPRDPQWGKYKDGYDGLKAYIYGAEYQTSNTFLRKMHDHDVPCAVCLVLNRSVVKMFPGKCRCKKWSVKWIFEEKNIKMIVYI